MKCTWGKEGEDSRGRDQREGRKGEEGKEKEKAGGKRKEEQKVYEVTADSAGPFHVSSTKSRSFPKQNRV